jgi:hypothetical protein
MICFVKSKSTRPTVNSPTLPTFKNYNKLAPFEIGQITPFEKHYVLQDNKYIGQSLIGWLKQ